MLGLGKKKASGPPAPPGGGRGPPTQKVLSMSSQGFSEPEIVRGLREEGYSPIEVDRAMKDAMRSGSAGSTQGAPPMPQSPPRPNMPPQPGPPQPPPAPSPGAPPGLPFPRQPDTGPGMHTHQPNDSFAPTKWDNDDDMLDSMPDDLDDIPKERKVGPDALMERMDDMSGPPLPPGPSQNREPLPFARAPLPKDKDERSRELKDRRRKEIEELTEEVAEEKMHNFMGRIGVIDERLDKLENDIKSVSAQPSGGSGEELGALRKDIDTQKESIEEVNARIDSIEEVVKGSLGPMIESVRKIKKVTSSPQPAQAPEPAKPEPEPKSEEAPKVDDKESEPGEPPRYAPKK